MASLLSTGSSVTITVDGLSLALTITSIFYLFCVLVIRRKLSQIHEDSPEFGTKKMLIISAGLVCLIRLMSFIGVVVLNSANVQAHYVIGQNSYNRNSDISSQDRNQYFYDKAITVLFDLPNCITVSTYVLLTLVWAECLLLSRFHTENTIKWRKRWLAYYMFFNVALYSTQMIFYFLVILPATSAIVTPMLNAVVTGMNFSAVFSVFVLYIILGIKFSGYPFRSTKTKEAMQKVSATIAIWSMTRVIWGVAMLRIYMKNIDLLQNNSGVRSSLFVFLLFLVCEILPIFTMLDYSYNVILEFESRASTEMRLLASGQRVVPFFKKKSNKRKKERRNTISEIEDDDEKLSANFDWEGQESVNSLSKFNWIENQKSLYGEPTLSETLLRTEDS